MNRAIRATALLAAAGWWTVACKDRRDDPPVATPPTPTAATTAVLDAGDDLTAALAEDPVLTAQLAALGCPGGECKPRNDDPSLVRCCRRQAEIMRTDPAWPAYGAPEKPKEIDVCVFMLEKAKATNPTGVDTVVKCMDLAKDARGALLCMAALAAKDAGQ